VQQLSTSEKAHGSFYNGEKQQQQHELATHFNKNSEIVDTLF